VLTVPPPSSGPTKPYTHLLCPVDFSESSLAALQYAFSIAQESDAHLTILNVFDWPTGGDERPIGGVDDRTLRRHVEEETRARLEGLITEDVRLWCKPETQFTHGKPYQRILETARTEGTDLIVMGVRGRNAFDVMLFGSTTNQVVRHATCPVLTLGR
jgi:nucleotide-binding universal stress UspA family protein